MRKLLTFILIVLVGVYLWIQSAIAAQAPKVFVCKFTGTPGVDEELQTGQNPISVSQNAIQNFQGVGSYFNDSQGRSYVLAFDTGQDEPSVDECPPPQTPPDDEPTPPTEPPTEPPIDSDEAEAQAKREGVSPK